MKIDKEFYNLVQKVNIIIDCEREDLVQAEINKIRKHLSTAGITYLQRWIGFANRRILENDGTWFLGSSLRTAIEVDEFLKPVGIYAPLVKTTRIKIIVDDTGGQRVFNWLAHDQAVGPFEFEKDALNAAETYLRQNGWTNSATKGEAAAIQNATLRHNRHTDISLSYRSEKGDQQEVEIDHVCSEQRKQIDSLDPPDLHAGIKDLIRWIRSFCISTDKPAILTRMAERFEGSGVHPDLYFAWRIPSMDLYWFKEGESYVFSTIELSQSDFEKGLVFSCDDLRIDEAGQARPLGAVDFVATSEENPAAAMCSAHAQNNGELALDNEVPDQVQFDRTMDEIKGVKLDGADENQLIPHQRRKSEQGNESANYTDEAPYQDSEPLVWVDYTKENLQASIDFYNWALFLVQELPTYGSADDVRREYLDKVIVSIALKIKQIIRDLTKRKTSDDETVLESKEIPSVAAIYQGQVSILSLINEIKQDLEIVKSNQAYSMPKAVPNVGT